MWGKREQTRRINWLIIPTQVFRGYRGHGKWNEKTWTCSTHGEFGNVYVILADEQHKHCLFRKTGNMDRVCVDYFKLTEESDNWAGSPETYSGTFEVYELWSYSMSQLLSASQKQFFLPDVDLIIMTTVSKCISNSFCTFSLVVFTLYEIHWRWANKYNQILHWIDTIFFLTFLFKYIHRYIFLTKTVPNGNSLCPDRSVKQAVHLACILRFLTEWYFCEVWLL
jgi:hypothetical protein